MTFDGFGLIYVADRRLDVDAVRAALPTGQLRHILFPADPVKHVPELVGALRTFFPVQAGTHTYGILVKLFFGAGHPIIRADLALLLERDSVADRSRLLVLGRISSALPQDKDAVLRLNLDVVGVFDLDSGEMAVDAVLYESMLCGRFVLTGAAAFRRAKGQGFALAVGGFNPRFRPPTGFPVVPRVTVALTTGDNPKLIVEAYFALTSNTVQFGARASLYAAAYGFSIEGYVGFDVLIQLWPPHFIADFEAGVQLKRGSRNLFKVDVRGMLEGPIPLRVAGRATFGILWWDYTVGFDRILIGGSGDVVTETLDVVAEVLTRLENPTSWRSELPPPPRSWSVCGPSRPARRSCCTRSAGSRSARGSCRCASTATSTGSVRSSRPATGASPSPRPRSAGRPPPRIRCSTTSPTASSSTSPTPSASPRRRSCDARPASPSGATSTAPTPARPSRRRSATPRSPSAPTASR